MAEGRPAEPRRVKAARRTVAPHSQSHAAAAPGLAKAAAAQQALLALHVLLWFSARGMVRTSDDEAEEEAAAAAAVDAEQQQQQQQQQQPAGVDGVSFEEMGSDNRLVMVVQQQGKRAPERLMVLGVRLRHGQQLPQAAPGDCADVPAAPGPHTLDLLTSGGSPRLNWPVPLTGQGWWWD